MKIMSKNLIFKNKKTQIVMDLNGLFLLGVISTFLSYVFCNTTSGVDDLNSWSPNESYVAIKLSSC